MEESTITYYINKETITPSYIDVKIVNFGFQKKDSYHSHGPILKGEHVFQYISSGEGFYTINGVKHTLKAGDMFYLPKNILVSYSSKCDNPYEYFWVGFDGDGVEKLINDIGVSQTMPIKSYCDAKITTIFDSMKNEVEKHTQAGMLNFLAEFYKLLSFLLSQANKNKLPLINADNYVDSAVTYIKNNYNDGELNVTTLSQSLGIGRSYFSVIFTEKMGVSPVEYIMQYRINQAKILLEQGNTVTDTAFNTGFNSSANFSYQFKRMTGISPVKYRNLYK